MQSSLHDLVGSSTVTTLVPGDLLLLQGHLDTTSLMTTEQIRTWTEKDPVLSRVRRFILSGWQEHNVGNDFTHFRRRKDELSVLDGCVLWGSRVIVPPPGREAVMEELHETLDLLHPDTNAKVLESQSRQKYGHDKHARARGFQVGERVYLQNFTGAPTWLT